MLNITSFNTELGIEYSEYATKRLGRPHWIVKKEFYFQRGSEIVTIPKGYLTDGATVPKGLRWLIPTWGKYGQACVLHDYLVEYPTVTSDDYTKSRNITRKETDEWFNEAMRILKVPKVTRLAMYAGVSAYRITKGVVEAEHWGNKCRIEKELKDHYTLTGIWL